MVILERVLDLVFTLVPWVVLAYATWRWIEARRRRRRHGVRISRRIEPLLRNTIHAAVTRDPSKLTKALAELSDDDKASRTVDLALRVITRVMRDAHRGEPHEAETRIVAHDIAALESWARLSPQQVFTFLSETSTEVPFGARAAPPEDTILLAFVVSAYLLSVHHSADEKWWHYLDRVERRIEAGHP